MADVRGQAILVDSVQLFKSAHMHPCKNHTLNIQKIVIIQQQKTFLHFL